MRPLGPGIAVAVSLVLLCGTFATAGVAMVVTVADAPTAAQCRRQWVDAAQAHGENGNPGGSTTVLNERWDRLDQRARRLARHAGRDDCGGRLENFDRTWNGLEGLQVDLESVLADAGDVHVADWRSRRAFVHEVAAVASQSQHLAVCQAALDLIEAAELDEE